MCGENQYDYKNKLHFFSSIGENRYKFKCITIVMN